MMPPCEAGMNHKDEGMRAPGRFQPAVVVVLRSEQKSSAQVTSQTMSSSNVHSCKYSKGGGHLQVRRSACGSPGDTSGDQLHTSHRRLQSSLSVRPNVIVGDRESV